MLLSRQSQDAAARPALWLCAIALVCSLAFALPSCTLGQGQTAADVAGIACKLVQIFDRTSRGELVGAFCEDVAKLVSDALAEQVATISATPQVSCDALVEIRSGNRVVGVACPAYAALASKSVAPKGAP
jgi:hypothetical protein